jgi:hypothetical protein
MAILVPIMLVGWIPLMLGVFALCRPRTAVLVSLFGAWLFLPMGGYTLVGLPDYGKITAGSAAALLGVLIFDPDRLRQLRFSAWDMPMLVVLLSPMMSSILNGYGVYDGLSVVFNIVMTCGIAYLLGRMYFSDAPGRSDLALAFFVAGLIYVPLCLYEMRFSPQLHKQVYGFAQHQFDQTYRMGGWRPMVFMQHGLAVGLFMAASAMVGTWLWLTKHRRTLAGVPMGVWVGILLATAVLCKSAFALVILIFALAAMLVVRATRWMVPVLLLALMPSVYMAGRITGMIDGKTVLAMVEPAAGDRIGSLGVRIRSEEILLPLAMRQPWWGASRWSSLVEDSRGERTDEIDYGFKAVPDALWIITLASRGLIGLWALALVFLVPVLALLRSQKNEPAPNRISLDPAVALAVVLSMHMMDNLLNAMVSPIFWLIASALTGMLATRVRARSTAPVVRFNPPTRVWN